MRTSVALESFMRSSSKRSGQPLQWTASRSISQSMRERSSRRKFGLSRIRSTMASITANSTLGANWLIVKGWNEKSRYEMKTQPQAQRLYDAIADNVNGVMQWIRVRW